MINEYLLRMKHSGIEPNFFCSSEYFEKAEFEEEWNDLSFWYSYEGKVMLPPIPNYSNFYNYTNEIWTGLEGIKIPGGWKKEFFDYEFIYDPKNFLSMNGSEWATFRKNVRKFPNRYKKELRYFSSELYPPRKIENLFIKWLNKDEESDVYDPEIIIRYLLNGKNRYFLVDENNELLGINVYDYNWKYLNFRFSFADPTYSFLSEYLRYCFYTDKTTLSYNKLVNDGGCLESEKLYNFKLKMNPLEIRKMYSWKKEER